MKLGPSFGISNEKWDEQVLRIGETVAHDPPLTITTITEIIAFIVGKSAGLDTGTASADYIQLYDGNAAILTESLEVIQHAGALGHSTSTSTSSHGHVFD